MPRTKKIVANEEVVAATPTAEEAVKEVEEATPAMETAPASEEPKYVDPRSEYTPLTRHQRKVLAKRRAKEKNRRKASRKNRK